MIPGEGIMNLPNFIEVKPYSDTFYLAISDILPII